MSMVESQLVNHGIAMVFDPTEKKQQAFDFSDMKQFVMRFVCRIGTAWEW